MHAGPYLHGLRAHAGVDLVGIWDDDPARGEKAAKDFGTTYSAQTKAVLAQPLDGVIVTSENIHHRALVEEICQAKNGVKAILCEKPLSTTAVDGRAMIDACRKAGIRLSTAFPCRYSAAFQRVLAVAKSGKLGQIRAIRTTNRGVCPFGWFVEVDKSGGGAVIDHTVHCADLNRVLLGVEAIEVYAETGSNMYHQSWEDCGFLTITYQGGLFSTIDASWSRPRKSFPTWGDVTMEIVADGGVVSLDLFNQTLTYYSESAGNIKSVGWGSNTDDGLIDDFVRAASGGEPENLATGEDGLRAAEVAFAAYESARTHAPITISPA